MDFPTPSADSFEVKITMVKIPVVETVPVLALGHPSSIAWGKLLVWSEFARLPSSPSPCSSNKPGLQLYPPESSVENRSSPSSQGHHRTDFKGLGSTCCKCRWEMQAAWSRAVCGMPTREKINIGSEVLKIPQIVWCSWHGSRRTGWMEGQSKQAR